MLDTAANRGRLLASVRRAFFHRAAIAPAVAVRWTDRTVLLQPFVEGEPDEVLLEALEVAHTEVIADFPYPEHGDPSVELEVVRADPGWDCLFDAQHILLGPVLFHLVRKNAAELRRALAARALAAARMLDDVAPLGPNPSAPRLTRILRDAAAELTTVEGFVPFVMDGDTLRVAYPWYGWISSHELGTLSCTIADVPLAYLPREISHAARFLRAVADLGPMLGAAEGPSEYTCSYCHGTFPALEFHAGDGACHGCAETHLGVVH